MSIHSDALLAQNPTLEKRNLWAHVIDGALFIAALNFISTVTVLPVLFEFLGANSLLIALAPQLLMLGFMLPSVLIAHWIDRLVCVKPYTMIMGVFQRLPFVISAVALLCFNDPKHYSWLLILIVCSILSIGLVSGFITAAWEELVHRTVHRRLRAGMFAARNAWAAGLGVLIGVIVERILAAYAGTTGYGLLFACASVGVCLSYIAFWFVREQPDYSKQERPRVRLIDNMKMIPRLMLSQPGFLMLSIVSALGTFYFLAIPFMAIDIRDRLGAGDEVIGRLLIWQMVGAIIGNIGAGYLGNHYGGRMPYVIGTMCMLISFLVLLLTNDEMLMFGAFALFGGGHFMVMVGQHTLMLELAPHADRASCLSGLRVFMVPFLLLASFAAAFLRDWWGGLGCSLILASMCALVSIVLILRIPEPRTHRSS